MAGIHGSLIAFVGTVPGTPSVLIPDNTLIGTAVQFVSYTNADLWLELTTLVVVQVMSAKHFQLKLSGGYRIFLL